ncbi:MAG: FecR family protein [Elusimicrobiota bacterium]|jgi:hypothetical protein
MPIYAEARRTVLFRSILSCCAFIFFAAQSDAATLLSSIDGQVFLRGPGAAAFSEAALRQVVPPGAEVKTAAGARAVITFEDGSKVEIGPKSSFVLEAADPSVSRMRLGMGWMKAVVTKMAHRRFSVRTPTAVCSVRGTEFDVRVGEDGRTSVDLFKGQLGVADDHGNEAVLREGQHVEVDSQGLGRVQGLGARGAEGGAADRERQALRREVGLQMTKEEVQSAAALEQKNAVYQQGKAMVDVNGNRVRIEEYILRPSADSYKFVVLNERSDRFDYFFRQGTFNKALPDDLSTALRQIPGCAGAPCDYWLTSYRTGYSNTQDSVVETASGGHLVDLNNNQVAGDEVTYAFDASRNDFTSISVPVSDTPGDNGSRNANTSFWRALYDTYSLAYNGVDHNAWTSGVGAYNVGLAGGANCSAAGVGFGCGGIQSMGHDVTGVGDQRTLVNTTVLQSLDTTGCDSLDNCTGYREDGKFHFIAYSQNAGGTVWDKYDTYVIDDNGKVASFSDFSGATGGRSYKDSLLKWNFQQIITASEFQGRKIDLVFEPKILIESGLIP